MQVERYPTGMPEEVRKGLFGESVFDQAQEFNSEKLDVFMADENVKAVHVFKNTPNNLEFAELRHQFPGKTRKQLRKMMKSNK